jgi:hypothetical protein
VTTTIVMPSRASCRHDLQHLVDHLRVERRGRLVEEHHLRVHGQRPGDRHPLLLAAGELRGVLVRLVGDAHPVQQLHRPPRGLRLAALADLDLGERHVLQDGLVGEQVERLEDHADLGPQPRQGLALLGQRPAVDHDRAGVDGLQPVDRPAQRRLAGPGRPDDHHHLPAADGEVDVLEDVQRTEVLVDVAQLDQRFAGAAVGPHLPDGARHGADDDRAQIQPGVVTEPGQLLRVVAPARHQLVERLQGPGRVVESDARLSGPGTQQFALGEELRHALGVRLLGTHQSRSGGRTMSLAPVVQEGDVHTAQRRTKRTGAPQGARWAP